MRAVVYGLIGFNVAVLLMNSFHKEWLLASESLLLIALAVLLLRLIKHGEEVA
jgi:hypothetical protein